MKQLSIKKRVNFLFKDLKFYEKKFRNQTFIEMLTETLGYSKNQCCQTGAACRRDHFHLSAKNCHLTCEYILSPDDLFSYLRKHILKYNKRIQKVILMALLK